MIKSYFAGITKIPVKSVDKWKVMCYYFYVNAI